MKKKLVLMLLVSMIVTMLGMSTGAFAAASTQLLNNPNNLIPIMTSDNAPLGKASAKDVLIWNGVIWSAYRAMDGSNAGYSSPGNAQTGWLQYKFASPKKSIVIL